MLPWTLPSTSCCGLMWGACLLPPAQVGGVGRIMKGGGQEAECREQVGVNSRHDMPRQLPKCPPKRPPLPCPMNCSGGGARGGGDPLLA